MTEVAHADECAVFYGVALTLAPEALVAQFVRRPVPWAIDCLLDVTDMSRVEGRRGWGEGGGDVTTEAVVGIRPGEATGGLVQGEAIVRKLLVQLRYLLRPSDDLRPRGVVADDFRSKGVVALLSHCPINALGMRLVVSKEKLLPTIEGRARELISTSVEMFGMCGATASQSPQQFWAGCVPVNHDKGGNFIALINGGDVEHIVDGGLFEIDMPPRAWVHTRLRACR